MKSGRLLYRTRQFWQALLTSPTPEDLELAAAWLSGAQLALFQAMQPSEQAHSARVARALLDQGVEDPDLLTAALLHDAGKSRCPLRPWERAAIVIARAICPDCAERWGRAGSGTDYRWRKPFVVAAQHPAWGEQIALAAGVTPRAAALIRRHQELLPPPGGERGGEDDKSLRALQAFDDNL